MRCIQFTAAIRSLVFITITLLMPVLVHSQTDQITTIVRSGSYEFSSGDKGERIVMEGFEYGMEPGKPMLPGRNVLIALPPGARVQKIETTDLGERLLPGIHRIAPAPRIMPLAEMPLRKELMARSLREWQENYRTVYTTDERWPGTTGKLVGSGGLRKYSYASVYVCPFSYRPQSGRLTSYDAVEITVHYDMPSRAPSKVPESGRQMGDRSVDRRAEELFVNFDQIRDLYSVPQIPADALDTYDYVIVTTSSLNSAVASSGFVAWKTALGFSVRTVLVTDAEITVQPGVDLAEQIRNFLRAYYGTWGIQYVLIVGDYTAVPMRYSYPDPTNHTHDPHNSGNAGGSVPSDNYYADLSLPDAESWDLDGDGFHGEYGEDNPDFLAEVSVGRIPTSDPARITYALEKLVAFEQDDGTWKDNVLQPGSILFYENQNYDGYPKVDGSTLLNVIEVNLMAGLSISHYTEKEGLDPSDFPWPAVSLTAFVNDWSTGQYGIVNWSGHGAPYGVARTIWETDDGDGVPESSAPAELNSVIMIDDLCALDDDYPSIVFAVSCNVGYPEPNGLGNLGIDLLTKPGFGAAAGIVSSARPAYVTVDIINNPAGAEVICYEFNRYLITQEDRIGDAIYNAKYSCYVNYGWAHFAEHVNQCNFNLYGDPSMMRAWPTTGVEEPDIAGIPDAFSLRQNYPNPFNPSTTIRFDLPHAAQARLSIYNAKGELVRTLVDRRMTEGRKEIMWNGRDGHGKNVASGVFFYSLTSGDFVQTRKMILLR
jgi:hypothetical protein